MDLSGKWFLTLNDENWASNNFGNFDSKEEVMDFINKNGANHIYGIYLDETGNELDIENSITVYIGKVEEYLPHIDAERIIDDLGEQAYDEVGEYAESYLSNVSKEQEDELHDELNRALEKWLSKHKLEPNFYKIVDVEEIVLNINAV